MAFKETDMVDLPTFTREGATYLPLEAVQALPRNAKLHDGEGIERSIEAFGFIDSATVNRVTGHLLGGHGRVDALAVLRDTGAEPPPGVVIADDGGWAMPVHLVEVPAADEEAAALALNRMVERGGDDHETLAEVLSDIKGVGESLFDATGYTRDEFADLLDEIAEEELDTARPDDEDVEIRPPDTVFALGDFRFPVARATYLDWHEALRVAAGFNKADIEVELARRLELHHFDAGGDDGEMV